MSSFVDQLIDDIGDINTYKSIPRSELENLGYVFSQTFIKVKTAKDKNKQVPDFIVYEVVDADTKKPASFSYLYYSSRKTGLVLKHPFSKYADMYNRTKAEEGKKS